MRTLPQPGFGMGTVLMLIVISVQIAFGLLVTEFSEVATQVFGANLDGFTRDPLVMAATNIAAFGVAISVGLLLNRLPPSRAFPLSGLSLSQLSGLSMVLIGGALLTSEAENVLSWLWPMPDWVRRLFEDVFLSNDRVFSRGFLIVIVAPITEELLFRGIILRGLLSRHRPATAAALSAILFAVVHLNPWQFITTFVLGLMFAWFYLRTGSVTVCILAHAIHNSLWMVLASRTFDIPGLTGLPNPGVVEFQPWWLDVLGLVLLTCGVWWFMRATPQGGLGSVVAPPVVTSQKSESTSVPPPLPH